MWSSSSVMRPHIILGEGLFLKLAQKIIWFSQLIEFVQNASYIKYEGHKQIDNRFAFLCCLFRLCWLKLITVFTQFLKQPQYHKGSQHKETNLETVPQVQCFIITLVIDRQIALARNRGWEGKISPTWPWWLIFFAAPASSKGS